VIVLARLCAAVLGVWLMAAPAVVDVNGAESSSMRVAGPAIVALAVAAGAPALDALRWLLIPLAGWLIVAPWFLGGSTAAVTVSVIVGALLVPLARIGHVDVGGRGGGWRAVGPLLRRPH
jgi:SPW repeat